MFYQLCLLYGKAKDAAESSNWNALLQCLADIEHIEWNERVLLAHINVRTEIFYSPVNKIAIIEKLNIAEQICKQCSNKKTDVYVHGPHK